MAVCLELRNFNLVSKFQFPRGALKYCKIYVHNLDQIHKFLLLTRFICNSLFFHNEMHINQGSYVLYFCMVDKHSCQLDSWPANAQ